MATVPIDLDDAAEGYLPETCMKCGQKAKHFVKKRFSWHPSWVWILVLAGLLPFAIVAVILTKRATLIAPFCSAHRRHWTIRTAVTLGGLLAFVAMIFAMVLVAGNAPPGRRNDNTFAIFGVALLVGGVVWLVAVVAFNFTSIRAQEITDDELILQGVCEQFADEYDLCVEEEEAKERERRSQRKRKVSRIENDADDFAEDDDRFR